MGLFDLFSNDTAENARDMANAGLQKGYDQMAGLYGQGRDAITSNYGAAAGTLTDAQGRFTGGVDAYGDATGANGPEGLKRATDAFKNSGEYGVFGVANKEAQQALERTHAAAGNPNSGNADVDAMTKASDLATKSWGNYTAGLAPYLPQYGTTAANIAKVQTGQGDALNASYDTQGNAANALFTGMGKNDAGAEMNNYNVGANQLNALLGVGNFISGGGATKLASGAKSLFSTFTG
jgi:hypothetical protein